MMFSGAAACSLQMDQHRLIAESWERIERWFSANVPLGLFRPSPGASRIELARAESALDLRFPADVRAAYEIHNGTRPGMIFYEDYYLAPLHEVVRSAGIMRAGLESGALPTCRAVRAVPSERRRGTSPGFQLWT